MFLLWMFHMKVLDTYVCTCMQINDETMGCFFINYVCTLVKIEWDAAVSWYKEFCVGGSKQEAVLYLQYGTISAWQF